MVSFKLAALAAVALGSLNVLAQDTAADIQVEDNIGDTPQNPAKPDIADVNVEDMQNYLASGGNQQWKTGSSDPKPLNVDVNVSFPDAEIFGVKLVNGRPTRALFHIANNEDTDINVLLGLGALLTPLGTPGAPEVPQVVRNMTGAKFGTVIAPKSKETLTYSFSNVMQPQDLTLELQTVIAKGQNMFTLTVFSESVSIVEAPTSILDPQIIFLYLLLAGIFGGTCYFIYNVWITQLFPQKKRGGKGGERAKRSSGGSKPVDPSEQVAVVGADGPAVTTGSKTYDESWIPASHLQRPQAKRVGSGRPKSRAA
ncbi:Increased recombination centers protein 22-2 [Fulvia fulva]|uniref:Increased recombination centers protein 22-2 n=1 Tax=Passalora fulva TaxID=5499 RepID=A0A9Q8P5W4_PASFU|nr:Increased recombination centers protein 22-2 [Fulvia fulva]KAK4632140.1 Increased recombination centers protein 22-2 [Fulvia fulva]UJO14413.1 Increased recombination centers protein 22-2 [Fulvia fulva]WPV10866.1 Increased recombination centers protein 22-2 [Fulvia fulva]WPV25394.1 Increased recombination centers protein 22-2 [Fulvia fulva]